MRAHRLIRPAPGAGDIPAVTSLIEDLGTPAFPASLFRAASAWVMPEHMAAFVFDTDMKPRTVFAENAGPAKVSQDVAVRYCREYHQYDLANRQLREAGYQGSWILKTSASEVIHSEYRHHCYTAVRLDDRISLSDTRDGRTLRINLYRPTRRRCSFLLLTCRPNWRARRSNSPPMPRRSMPRRCISKS